MEAMEREDRRVRRSFTAEFRFASRQQDEMSFDESRIACARSNS
jgi:hypothetical protein